MVKFASYALRAACEIGLAPQALVPAVYCTGRRPDQAVVQLVDPITHGLFFRPNGIMQKIMLKTVGRVSDGVEGGALVGSSRDSANRKQMKLGPSGVIDLREHIVDDSAHHIIYIV